MSQQQSLTGDDSNGSPSPRGEGRQDPADSTQSNVVPLRPPERSIGYGRPPIHSRFKPGQSGNLRGRPKGSGNALDERRKFYTTKIVIRAGGKKRRVSRLAALEWSVWERAMKGNQRAAQLCFGNAKALGLFDDVAEIPTTSPRELTNEEIRRLSYEELQKMIEAEKTQTEIIERLRAGDPANG